MSEQDTTQVPPTGAPKQKIQKRQLLFLVGAIVVGIMFITSYAAFGNNGSASTSTTSTILPTLPVFGYANATVAGYTNSLTLTVRQGNVTGTVNQTLSNLEANNSINDYIQTSSSFVIYASKSNPYQIQQLFLSELPPNSIAINGTESVAIPSVMTLYYAGETGPQPLSVYTNTTNFTISTGTLLPLGSKLNASVRAIVFENGVVYQNNIEVSEA